MRFLGVCILSLLCAFLGVFHKAQQDYAIQQNKKMLEFLRFVAAELRDNQGDSEEILRKAKEQISGFDFLMNLSIGSGGIHPIMMAAAAKEASVSRREWLLRFCRCFGLLSLENQLDEICYLEQLCREELQNQLEQYRKEGNLSLQIGLLSAVAVFILLL